MYTKTNVDNNIYKYETKEYRMKKYLDIDSTYRDRKTFPNSNDFVIPFNFQGRKSNAFLTPDGVSEASFFTGSTGGLSTTGSMFLDPTVSSTQENYYVNDILEVNINGTPQYRKIVYFSGTGLFRADVDPAFSTGVSGLQYAIRQAIPLLQGSLQNGSTLSGVILSTGAVNSDNYYRGSFIKFTSGSNNGIITTISSYTGSTKFASLNTTLISDPGNSTFEILQFSYDNCQPLLYCGTLNFSQPICYRMRLLNLAIPNELFNSGNGGFIKDYPYIYLRLYEEGSISAEQTLYSNNPNSKLALFKVPIYATNYSSASNFVTLDGGGMEQTVKFRPNSALRFTLTFPDGEVLSFMDNDNFPPVPPDPLFQISATIELERLD